MTIDIKSLFGETTNLNAKMVNVIIKAIAANQKSEMDYLKFKHSVLNLQDLDMDEPKSIQSAFATLQTMGVKKADIIDSIRHYSVIVQKEKEEFALALKNKITNKIDKPTKEALSFDDKIRKKKEEIEKLQKQIEIIEQRKLTIKDEIETARTKIEKTRDEFAAVYEFFAKCLDNDKILFEQVIK